MDKNSKPTPWAKFNSEVTRNYRWNFVVNILDWVFFYIGMAFASATTILPAFARHLTTSNFLIGLIPSLHTLGLSLPQILIANFVQKLERKKDFVIIVTIGERIPWLLLFLAVVFLPSSSPILLLTILLILYGLFSFSGGFGNAAWQDMLAKIIPLPKRGRFFGWGNFLGGGISVFAAFWSIHLLRRFPFPNNFAFCFLFAFIATAISYIFIILIKEPAWPAKNKESSFKEYLRQLPQLLKKDRNFLFFLITNIFLSFGGMATSFFAVYAMNKLTLPDSEIGIFTLLLLAGQAMSSILWGYLGDKKGYKLVMVLATLVTIVAILTAAIASSIYLFYLSFFIIGCSLSAYFISNMGIVLEFCLPEKRPTYIALANTIKAPFISLAPVIGGILADAISFPFVFILTIFILLGGLLCLLFLVREPRHVLSSSSQ